MMTSLDGYDRVNKEAALAAATNRVEPTLSGEVLLGALVPHIGHYRPSGYLTIRREALACPNDVVMAKVASNPHLDAYINVDVTGDAAAGCCALSITEFLSLVRANPDVYWGLVGIVDENPSCGAVVAFTKIRPGSAMSGGRDVAR